MNNDNNLKNRISIIGNSFLAIIKSFPKLMAIFFGGVIPILLIYFNTAFETLPLSVRLICSFGFFFIAFMALTIWNMANSINELKINSLYANRRYKLFSSTWHFELDQDETYFIMVECRRRLICLRDSIAYINVSYTLEENNTPFSEDAEYNFVVKNQNRISYNGVITADPVPYKATESNLSFKIKFNPPLHPGDEVEFTYEHFLPHYKSSTLEKLREREKEKNTNAYDFVFHRFKISYPADEFLRQLIFEPECNVKPRGFARFSGGQEIDLPPSEDLKIFYDDNSRLIMSFRQTNPEVNSRYMISWIPPRRSELTASTNCKTGKLGGRS